MSQLDRLVKRQLDADKELKTLVAQILPHEARYGATSAAHFIDLLRAHRQLISSEPAMLVAEIAELVAARTVLDAFVSRAVTKQPGLASLIEPVAKLTRERFAIVEDKPAAESAA